MSMGAISQPTEETIVPGEKGVYYVGGQTWSVGSRYKLVKVLGSGSFSSVCLAEDVLTGEQVALKRIADVLNSEDNAKRVLREVCILRRLQHPYIIELRDLFMQPSATGRYVYRGGRLVPTSFDVYIGMEYGDLGDLYHMKGQLTENDVKGIMCQLLLAVKYLHDNNVWHRDIKSANVMLTSGGGVRTIKLADLGSARSAIAEGYHTAEQKPAIPPTLSNVSQLAEHPPKPQQPFLVVAGGTAMGRGSVGGKEDVLMDGGQEEGSDLYARPHKAGGYHAPLTRLVCTPCYRAPEVVMSRGGYTSALDMWSVGCIFGELLQRCTKLGHATNPNLRVAPVFAIRGSPPTPETGDKFEGGPGNPVTREELNALFAVIGTPAWSCVEGVDSPAWRQYLRRMKGRAPTLYRRFGAAGEPAVDLLSRFLTFDPRRRVTAEEALAHEYFSSYTPPLELPPSNPVIQLQRLHLGSEPSSPEKSYGSPPEQPSTPPCHTSLLPPPHPTPPKRGAPPFKSTSSEASMDVDERGRGEGGRGEGASGSERIEEGDSPMAPPEKRCKGGGHGLPYFPDCTARCQEDPASILATLEEDMAAAYAVGGGGTDLLRRKLEEECRAHQEHRRQRGMNSPPTSPMKHADWGAVGPLTFVNWGHLRPDPGQAIDAAEAGAQRIPHHADSEQGAAGAMAPEVHLKAGRHGEWAEISLGRGKRCSAMPTSTPSTIMSTGLPLGAFRRVPSFRSMKYGCKGALPQRIPGV